MCDSFELSSIVNIVKSILNLVQILAPILLIISMAFILVKLVQQPEDKKLMKNLKNSIIATIVVFFIPLLVQVTLRLAGDTTFFSSCWNSNTKSLKGEVVYQDVYDDNDKKQILSNSEIYENGEKNTTSENNSSENTSNLNNSSRQERIQKFLSIMEHYSEVAQSDAKNGRKWTYNYSRTKYTFAKTAATTRTATCVMLPVWGLVDLGLIEEGDQFNKPHTGRDSRITFFKRGKSKDKQEKALVKARFENSLEFIDGGFKTAKTLINNGTMQPGDIIFWGSLEHVSVYAGNKKWYDAGRVGPNGSGSMDNYKFKTFGPLKLPSAMRATVYKIGRIK